MQGSNSPGHQEQRPLRSSHSTATPSTYLRENVWPYNQPPRQARSLRSAQTPPPASPDRNLNDYYYHHHQHRHHPLPGVLHHHGRPPTFRPIETSQNPSSLSPRQPLPPGPQSTHTAGSTATTQPVPVVPDDWRQRARQGYGNNLPWIGGIAPERPPWLRPQQPPPLDLRFPRNHGYLSESPSLATPIPDCHNSRPTSAPAHISGDYGLQLSPVRSPLSAQKATRSPEARTGRAPPSLSPQKSSPGFLARDQIPPRRASAAGSAVSPSAASAARSPRRSKHASIPQENSQSAEDTRSPPPQSLRSYPYDNTDPELVTSGPPPPSQRQTGCGPVPADQGPKTQPLVVSESGPRQDRTPSRTLAANPLPVSTEAEPTRGRTEAHDDIDDLYYLGDQSPPPQGREISEKSEGTTTSQTGSLSPPIATPSSASQIPQEPNNSNWRHNPKGEQSGHLETPRDGSIQSPSPSRPLPIPPGAPQTRLPGPGGVMTQQAASPVTSADGVDRNNDSGLPETIACKAPSGAPLPSEFNRGTAVPNHRRNLTMARRFTTDRLTLRRRERRSGKDLWSILRRYVLRRQKFRILDVLFLLRSPTLSSRYLELPQSNAETDTKKPLVTKPVESKRKVEVFREAAAAADRFFGDCWDVSLERTHELALKSCFLPIRQADDVVANEEVPGDVSERLRATPASSPVSPTPVEAEALSLLHTALTREILQGIKRVIHARIRDYQGQKNLRPKDHYVLRSFHSFYRQILANDNEASISFLDKDVKHLVRVFEKVSVQQLPADNTALAKSVYKPVRDAFLKLVIDVMKQQGGPSGADSAKKRLHQHSKRSPVDPDLGMPSIITHDRLLAHVREIFGFSPKDHAQFFRSMTAEIVSETRQDFESLRGVIEEPDLGLQMQFESVEEFEAWRAHELHTVSTTLSSLNNTGTLWRYHMRRSLDVQVKTDSRQKARIIVVEARNLLAKSKHGASDAYCTVRTGSVSKSTRVVKSLNPQWNEAFEIDFDDLSDFIEISVWDYQDPVEERRHSLASYFKSNEGDRFLGIVKLSVPGLLNLWVQNKTGERFNWHRLGKRTNKSRVSGEVKVVFELETQAVPEPALDVGSGVPVALSIGSPLKGYFSIEIETHFKRLFQACLQSDSRSYGGRQLLSNVSWTLLDNFSRRWGISEASLYVTYLRHLTGRMVDSSISFQDIARVFGQFVDYVKSGLVVLNRRDHQAHVDIVDSVSTLTSVVVERYRDYFPFNTPEGELSSALAAQANALVAMGHSNEEVIAEIRELVVKGSTTLWYRISEEANPLIHDPVLRLVRLTELTIENLETDMLHFSDPFGSYIDLPITVLGPWSKFYALEIENLVSFTGESTLEVQTEVFDLMGKVRKFMLLAKKLSFRLNYVLEFDRLFGPYVLRFLKHVDDQAQDIVSRALSAEQIESKLDGVLYSSSFRDVTKILHHTLSFVVEKEMDSEKTKLKFLRAFAGIVLHFVRIYCSEVRKEFSEDLFLCDGEYRRSATGAPPPLATRGSMIRDSPKGSRVSPDPATRETSKHCTIAARLNNVLEASVRHIPDLFDSMPLAAFTSSLDESRDSKSTGSLHETISSPRQSLGESSRATSPKTPHRLSPHFLVSIQSTKSKNLMVLDWHGHSDPVLCALFRGRELWRTRVVDSDLIAQYEEQFIVPASPSDVLSNSADETFLDFVVMEDPSSADDEELGKGRFWFFSQFVDKGTIDYHLPLSPQGSLNLKISVTTQTYPAQTDLVSEIKRAQVQSLKTVSAFLRDSIHRVIGRMMQGVENGLEKVVRRYAPAGGSFVKAFDGLLNRSREDPKRLTEPVGDSEVRELIDPTLQFLDDQLGKSSEFVEADIARDLVMTLWRHIVVCIETMLVPPLGSRPSKRKSGTPSSRQLESLMIAMEVLKQFLHADGEGVCMQRLETEEYNRVKLIAELCLLEVGELEYIYHTGIQEQSETCMTKEHRDALVVIDESPTNGGFFETLRSSVESFSFLELDAYQPGLGGLVGDGMGTSPALGTGKPRQMAQPKFNRLVRLLRSTGDAAAVLNVLKAKGERAFVSEKLNDISAAILSPPRVLTWALHQAAGGQV